MRRKMFIDRLYKLTDFFAKSNMLLNNSHSRSMNITLIGDYEV